MQEVLTQLISAAAIDRRLAELARTLNTDYAGRAVTLVCILKGSILVLADLARKLSFPVEFDFMDIESYGDRTESSGIIKINKDLRHPVAGKQILLIEDIIDSGRTLGYLLEHLRTKRPAGMKVLALLDKPARRVVDGVLPDYVGFEIPDAFVVGYGLDYAQRYRNLPYIATLSFQDE
jgi:hypoxanthine phosphoribosyltransferase